MRLFSKYAERMQAASLARGSPLQLAKVVIVRVIWRKTSGFGVSVPDQFPIYKGIADINITQITLVSVQVRRVHNQSHGLAKHQILVFTFRFLVARLSSVGRIKA